MPYFLNKIFFHIIFKLEESIYTCENFLTDILIWALNIYKVQHITENLFLKYSNLPLFLQDLWDVYFRQIGFEFKNLYLKFFNKSIFILSFFNLCGDFQFENWDALQRRQIVLLKQLIPISWKSFTQYFYFKHWIFIDFDLN